MGADILFAPFTFAKKALVGERPWFTDNVALARVQATGVQDSGQGRGGCGGGYEDSAE